MEFSPKAQSLLAGHPWLAERAELVCEELPEKAWSAGRAAYAHRTSLIDHKHELEAEDATWHREAEVYASVVDDRGAAVPGNARNGPLMTDLERTQRRLKKARAALDKFNEESKVPAGRTGWTTKGKETASYLDDFAGRGGVPKRFLLKVAPSRKAMAEAAKVAEAGHVERRKLMEAFPDKATAAAMVRGLTRSPNPMRVQFTGYAMARTLRLPLIDLKWGEGRSAPSPEDVTEALLWLAGERIQDDLLGQLDRQYSSFADRGIPTLSEPDRRRELARVDGAVHAAELEEAAHLIALIEDEGTLLLPPARMSARALLGIA